MASLSRSCCISPCKEKKRIETLKVGSAFVTSKILHNKTVGVRTMISKVNLKKPSFFKPLLHRHHFIITILPFICNHRCNSVCCNLCTRKFTVKSFSFFLKGRAIKHSYISWKFYCPKKKKRLFSIFQYKITFISWNFRW